MKLKDKQALIADNVLLCLAAVNIIVMIVMMITDNDYVLVPVSLFSFAKQVLLQSARKEPPSPVALTFLY